VEASAYPFTTGTGKGSVLGEGNWGFKLGNVNERKGSAADEDDEGMGKVMAKVIGPAMELELETRDCDLNRGGFWYVDSWADEP
jgi:hypothetical protein